MLIILFNLQQSYEARERRNDSSLPFHLGYGNLNGDGFGIGWYSACCRKDPSPCTFTSVTPAWNNDNLNRLATKLESGLIFAHVRAAYPGMPVSEQNCHPFAFGNYLFMHNGVIAGFLDIRRQLLAALSDEAYNSVQSFHSDSAVCFGLFLHHLEDMHRPQTPETMLRAVQDTIATINRIQKEHGICGTSLLNFVVTDGVNMIATRYASDPDVEPASLYYAEGYSYQRATTETDISSGSIASKTIHSDKQPSGSATGTRGEAVIGESDYGLTYAGTETRVCLVASEPVTSCSSDWNTVGPNTALVICKDDDGILTVVKAWLCSEREHPDNNEVYRCLETVQPKSQPQVPEKSRPRAHIQLKDVKIANSANVTPRHEFGDLRLEDVNTPRLADDPVHILSGHNGPVTTAKAHGSLFFSGGADGLIKVWDVLNFSCIKTLSGHRDPIRMLAVCDTILISAGARTLRCWSLDTYECLSVIHTNSKGSITALTALPDGTAYVGSVDCRIKMYPGASLISTLREKDINVDDKGAGFSMKGTFMLGASSVTSARDGHCASVTCLVVCGDMLCSGSHDATIRVWDVSDLSFKKVLRGHRGSVLTLGTMNGFLLSGGRDKAIRVWDVDTWVCCHILRYAH